MNRLCTVFVALILSGALSTAHAVPPTVTPSPGYDARLQEQRAAAAKAASPEAAPVTPRRHKKPKGN